MSATRLSSLPPLRAGALAAALVSIQVRNLDAMIAALKAAMDGMGSLARQQRTMLGATLEEAAGLPAALGAADPRAAIARPFEAAKGAILDGTAQANLLGELAARSGADIAGILQTRMLASLDETKVALLQAMAPAEA